MTTDRVSARSTTPTTAIDAASITTPAAAAPSVTGAAGLLPSPTPFTMFVGDDAGSEIAAMVLTSAKDDRDAQRKGRDSEEALARSAEASQLSSMQERADKTFQAGVVGGLSSIAAGGMTLGAAGATAGGHTATAQGIEGSSKALEGGAKLASTALQRSADDGNIGATKNEQLAGRFHRAADDARDGMKNARDLGDQAIGFYKEYVAAKGEAEKAAIFRA